MEEEVKEEQSQIQEEEDSESVVEKPAEKKVSFPTRRRRRMRINKKILIIFGVILVGAIVGWFVSKGGEPDVVEEPTPTPVREEPTSASTETPKPINREEIKIQILNGTRIPKEASFLKEKLEALGYADIEVENADEQDNEVAIITFSSTMSDEVIDEITNELGGIYQDITTKTSETLDFDIQVITGLREGQTLPTPLPTQTPTPTLGVSPTSTPSATPTP